MTLFAVHPPADNDSLRRAIYAGAVFRLPATQASLALAEDAQGRLQAAFGDAPREAHRRMSAPDFLSRMAAIRADIVADQAALASMQAVLRAAGFDPAAHAIDALRLRANMPDAHLIPAAAQAYAPHRDTWYANPQSQVNWWIPLHDITPACAFSFYPAYFTRAIRNTSAGFSYARWMELVGWQNAKGAKEKFPYPELLEPLDTAGAESFSCRRGEILLFSASHLHQSNPNLTPYMRYSLDFRSVHLADHAAGIGAVNVDNGSEPDAMKDYIFPQGATA